MAAGMMVQRASSMEMGRQPDPPGPPSYADPALSAHLRAANTLGQNPDTCRRSRALDLVLLDAPYPQTPVGTRAGPRTPGPPGRRALSAACQFAQLFVVRLLPADIEGRRLP